MSEASMRGKSDAPRDGRSYFKSICRLCGLEEISDLSGYDFCLISGFLTEVISVSFDTSIIWVICGWGTFTTSFYGSGGSSA